MDFVFLAFIYAIGQYGRPYRGRPLHGEDLRCQVDRS